MPEPSSILGDAMMMAEIPTMSQEKEHEEVTLAQEKEQEITLVQEKGQEEVTLAESPPVRKPRQRSRKPKVQTEQKPIQNLRSETIFVSDAGARDEADSAASLPCVDCDKSFIHIPGCVFQPGPCPTLQARVTSREL